MDSRPRESASEPFFNELLGLFNYPPGSARALLAGTLPLRCCATRFASGAPTWRLPMPGHVARLLAANSGVVQEVVAEGVAKTPCTPRRFSASISSTGMEEIVSRGVFQLIHPLIVRGGDAIRMMGDLFLLRTRRVDSQGLVQAHVSR